MKESKKKEPCGLRAISIAIHKASPRKKNNKKGVNGSKASRVLIVPVVKKPCALRKVLEAGKGRAIPAKKLKIALAKSKPVSTRARVASALRQSGKKRKTTRKYR